MWFSWCGWRGSIIDRNSCRIAHSAERHNKMRTASVPTGLQLCFSHKTPPTPPLETVPTHRTKSITSPSNPFIKHCVKLRHSSSYRHSHGHALVVGTTPIREITRFQECKDERRIVIDSLLLLDGAKVPKGLCSSCSQIVCVSSTVIKKISGLQSIDSIEAIALIKIPTSFCNMEDYKGEPNFRHWFPSPHRILVLDGIQDPGNLGTLLRSALAFGWKANGETKAVLGHGKDGAFLLPSCCDPFNEKALRASRGACFQLPIVSGEWEHLETLRDEFQMKMLAAHPPEDGVQMTESSFISQLADTLARQRTCLVLGSEGHGLSDESKEACELITIPKPMPMFHLNVNRLCLFILQDAFRAPISI
ncbi:hypothetical protein Sjap_006119 [Stephania japonica]|uniref:tRNA/rRNA methyltransferase SpoU type domain-containing protein n=1 Tax=Stephania japonica TaxID=461633 RepID=A0AAP0PMI2_9MAGN